MINLVYYTAPWCAPCKAQWPTTERVAKKLNISIEKREIDGNSAKYWGILSVPTLLVLREGQEIYRHVGITSEERLIDALENLR